MIDYEKLREAHELAERISNISVMQYWSKCIEPYVRIFYANNDDFDDFENLDDLITKLRELTEPMPKYKVGDTLWILNDSDPQEIFISDIYWNQNHFGYESESIRTRSYWAEDEMYPSKEALIEAQIEYWSKMRDDHIVNIHEMVCQHLPQKSSIPSRIKTCIKCWEEYVDVVCEHESDGQAYSARGSFFNKCKKCGEFYR